MKEKQIVSEWTGLKGKIMARFLNSPFRTLIEVWLLGLPRSTFLNEVSRRIHSDAIVLDVGSGSGYFSLAIAKELNVSKVICFDLSEVMLQRLKHKAKKEDVENKIQIMNGEASSLKLDDGSVDLVVSNFVLHEVSNPESVLLEMIRVLKSDRWVIITDFLSNTLLGKMEVRAHSKEAHGPFDTRELESLFNKAGLKEIKVFVEKRWIIGIGKK